MGTLPCALRVRVVAIPWSPDQDRSCMSFLWGGSMVFRQCFRLGDGNIFGASLMCNFCRRVMSVGGFTLKIDNETDKAPRPHSNPKADALFFIFFQGRTRIHYPSRSISNLSSEVKSRIPGVYCKYTQLVMLTHSRPYGD